MIVNDTSKNKRSLVILGIVLGVLQLAVVPNVALVGGRCNLALVFVALACLGGSAASAPAIGFGAGLFYDLAGSGPIGLMALLLTLLGFALASAGRSRVSDDPAASVTIFVPASLLVGFLYAIVLLVVGQASSFVEVVFLRALPGCVLDVVAFAVCAFVLARFGSSPSGFGGGKGSRGGSRFSTKGL